MSGGVRDSWTCLFHEPTYCQLPINILQNMALQSSVGFPNFSTTNLLCFSLSYITIYLYHIMLSRYPRNHPDYGSSPQVLSTVLPGSVSTTGSSSVAWTTVGRPRAAHRAATRRSWPRRWTRSAAPCRRCWRRRSWRRPRRRNRWGPGQGRMKEVKWVKREEGSEEGGGWS